MGEKADMNRANEVRPMFRRLAEVAERTGRAVILIGHLNKAAGGQSAYRGLGSIDFQAAARSVLLIGRVKREPNVRVIVHDKSSLAPERGCVSSHIPLCGMRLGTFLFNREHSFLLNKISPTMRQG